MLKKSTQEKLRYKTKMKRSDNKTPKTWKCSDVSPP